MKKTLEIFLHGPGSTEEKVIKIPEDAVVVDVVAAAEQAGFRADPDLKITVEDTDEPLAGKARLRDCGVKHKHHLHCHVCRKIEVTVQYNGQEKERRFAPSRRVKGVLRWALRAFGLEGPDAEGKELRLGGEEGEILNSHDHIGSFAVPPCCKVDLFLTSIVEVQG